MDWKKFRKTRMDLLAKAIADQKMDREIIDLVLTVSKNVNLAPLSSCAGRIVLQRKKPGKQASDDYRSWHKADKEEIELAISTHDGKHPLWFVVEPYTLSIAAKDSETALIIADKAGKEGAVCRIMERKDRVDVELKGTASFTSPIDPVEGQWDEIVKLANLTLEENFKAIRRLERKISRD